MTSLSPCSTVSFPSQDCTMDIDFHGLKCGCFSALVEVTQDSSCHLLTCDSSSVTVVTHDFDDSCVFMLDSLQDLSPPGIVDHDLVASAPFHVSCSTDVFQFFPTDHDGYSSSPAPVDFDPAYAIFLHSSRLGHL